MRAGSRESSPPNHLKGREYVEHIAKAMIMASTDSELESFRRQWLDEVSGRIRPGSCSAEVVAAKGAAARSSNDTKVAPAPEADPLQIPLKPPSSPSLSRRQVTGVLADPISPTNSEIGGPRDPDMAMPQKPPPEPCSALEHYETAVEKEAQGRLGDSLKHYRLAYKVRDSTQSVNLDGWTGN